MKSITQISFNFFNKVLGLINYLEESSLKLFDLVKKLTDEEIDSLLLGNYLETLAVIYSRSIKTKMQLIEAAFGRHEIYELDELFMFSLQNISKDLEQIHIICDEIGKPD